MDRDLIIVCADIVACEQKLAKVVESLAELQKSIDVADTKVAKHYAMLLDELKVSSNLRKSLKNTETKYKVACEYQNELQKENALLKQQVQALAKKLSSLTVPSNFDGYYSDWKELLVNEQVQVWIKWARINSEERGGK
jgi:hypothetical protein